MWVTFHNPLYSIDKFCETAPIFGSKMSKPNSSSNLQVLDIIEVKTVPYTPASHPFVE